VTLENPEGETRKVIRIIVHPNFKLSTFDSDFALLKLDRPFVFNSFINAVKLPKIGEKIKDGTVCVVSGFGLTETYENAEQLMATKVTSN
jgi:hypothetical protein